MSPTDVYITIKCLGDRDRHYWWWESGRTNIPVSDEKAELLGLLVLSKPITSVGENIVAEATIKNLMKTDDLTLDFWVETPSDKIQRNGKSCIKKPNHWQGVPLYH